MASNDSFGGVCVFYVSDEVKDELYAKKRIQISALGNITPVVKGESSLNPIDEINLQANLKIQNIYCVIKSPSRHTLTATVQGHELVVIRSYEQDSTDKRNKVYGLHARNKEQSMALNALMDDDITCVVLEGAAGTGKTILAMAMAFHKLLEEKIIKKIIFSRPMSSVGVSLGALPGSASEKFSPYLMNYHTNAEVLGMPPQYFETLVEKEIISFIPLQLIGGASWHDTLVIVDEAQTLTPEEYYAIGSRIAEGSRLVLLGDLAQRYGRRCKAEETGQYIFVNSPIVWDSELVATIKLIKQERSPLCSVFYDCFFGQEEG